METETCLGQEARALPGSAAGGMSKTFSPCGTLCCVGAGLLSRLLGPSPPKSNISTRPPPSWGVRPVSPAGENSLSFPNALLPLFWKKQAQIFLPLPSPPGLLSSDKASTSCHLT